MALNDQQGRPAGTNLGQVITTWRVTSLRTGLAMDGSHVAVQFQTTAGMPLLIALTNHHAAELAKQLQEVLAAQTKPKRRPH